MTYIVRPLAPIETPVQRAARLAAAARLAQAADAALAQMYGYWSAE